MIQLVCIDVDGTLVGSSATVRPDVWAAVDAARAAGLRLAICSGRPAFGVARGYAERLDAAGWHVFQNGASVVHLGTLESVSDGLPAGTVAALVAAARRTGQVLELYTDTEYAVESTDERARTHAALLGLPPGARPFDSLAGRVVRAQWVVPREEAAALLAGPHPGLEVAASTSPVMPDTVFVNVTPVGVTKASAVRRVAAAYGVPLAAVMFVGDGDNDVAAMRTVGFPVAMANAEPAVHAVARAAVGHVDDGGLAEALALAREGAGSTSRARG